MLRFVLFESLGRKHTGMGGGRPWAGSYTYMGDGASFKVGLNQRKGHFLEEKRGTYTGLPQSEKHNI